MSIAIPHEIRDDWFPHRKNVDGTFDSICPHCFATIAHAQRETDLEQVEREHSCFATWAQSLGPRGRKNQALH
jgi:hypothetical protein